jgi:UDP-glucose 4-epimerase
VEQQQQQQQAKKCLVTGATGVVGVPLVNELVRLGHRVSILARGAVAENLFAKSVKVVRGDLANQAALEEAAAGANWIFHLAAKLHISSPNEKLRQEYRRTNVEGTRRLLDLASSNNAEKFVFFSTINVYGASRAGEVFDETSELNATGFYAESKAEAEKLVLAAENPGGEKIGVCLRLAAVYGSRMKGNYVRLLEAVRRGRFFFVGDGGNRRTLIQQDAARAAILAAENAAGGEVYNATDGAVRTFREIVEAMSAALGKETPRLHLPAAPVRFGVGAVESFGNLIGLKSPINRALLDKLLEDAAVSGDKIRNDLGFRPQFDLRNGWREAVANKPEEMMISRE